MCSNTPINGIQSWRIDYVNIGRYQIISIFSVKKIQIIVLKLEAENIKNIYLKNYAVSYLTLNSVRRSFRIVNVLLFFFILEIVGGSKEISENSK